MRYLVVIAALAAVSLFVLALFLPVWIRLRARVGPDRFGVRIWVRLPLIPWYIPLPELTPDKLHRLRQPKTRRAPKDMEPDLSAEPTPDRERARTPDAVPLTKKIRRGMAAFRKALPLVREILREVAGIVRVRKLSVRGHLGVGDAFQTALLLGGLNSAAFLLLRTMHRQGFRFDKKPVIWFAPRYDTVTFDAKIDVETGASVVGFLKLGWHLRKATQPLLMSRTA